MEQKICQSCAMPLTSEDMYSTEKDGYSSPPPYMRMDDGRECRVSVEFDGWERMVNGISEYDAFDGILYAG